MVHLPTQGHRRRSRRRCNRRSCHLMLATPYPMPCQAVHCRVVAMFVQQHCGPPTDMIEVMQAAQVMSSLDCKPWHSA